MKQWVYTMNDIILGRMMTEQRIYSVKYVEQLEAVYEAVKDLEGVCSGYSGEYDRAHEAIAAVEAQDNLKKD